MLSWYCVQYLRYAKNNDGCPRSSMVSMRYIVHYCNRIDAPYGPKTLSALFLAHYFKRRDTSLFGVGGGTARNIQAWYSVQTRGGKHSV